MQTRKRWLPAATIAVIAAVSLVGCSGGGGGGGGGGEDDNELKLMFWNSGSAVEERWRALADAFIEDNPEVTIDLVPVAGENWGTYLANAAIQIAGGQNPDLIFTAVEGLEFLSSNNLILPINDYVENDPEGQELVDGLLPGLENILSTGGEQWMMPIATNNMVMYYNTDRFTEAGLEPPTADWTWEDFLETAEALTEDTNGDGTADRYGFSWTSNEIFPGILPWVVNQDGNLISEDKCSPTINSEPVVEAVSFLYDLIYEHQVSPAPAQMGDLLSRFQTGEIAMMGAGGWPSDTFFQAGFSAFDIQKMPTGSTYATVHGGNGFATMRTASNPDLAWDFQKFATANYFQKSSIPAQTAIAETWPTEGAAANAKLYATSFTENPTIPWFPNPTQYSDYEAATLRSLQLIFAGETGVQEGLDAAQEELSTIVMCN